MKKVAVLGTGLGCRPFEGIYFQNWLFWGSLPKFSVFFEGIVRIRIKTFC